MFNCAMVKKFELLKEQSVNSLKGSFPEGTEHEPSSQLGQTKTEQSPPPSEEHKKGSVECIKLRRQPLEPLPGIMATPNGAVSAIAKHYAQILHLMGYDLKDPSLTDTPLRAARALVEMHQRTFPVMKTFEEETTSDGLIAQNGIWVRSLCEHHLLPFFGTACVAILPQPGCVLGLSKYARLVKYYASTLATQERITRQTAERIAQDKELRPLAVGVSLRCYHTCMSLRGVEDTSAVTTTTHITGVFRTDASAKAEFLSAIKHPDFMQ